jgi:FkbM family methyltransferase
MAVLDIGANIGYYALLELELVGPEGRVTLVEPSPDNVALLRRNLALNGHADLDVHEGAVSDRSGSRAFHLSTMSNLHTFHALPDGGSHLEGRAIDVQTATVPELVPDGRLDLIRMDVEGHEVEVLTGMLDAVRAGTLRPMILFETHFDRYGPDHDMAAVLRDLFAADYHARYVGSSSERGTAIVEAKGYRGGAPIRTDDMRRVIFENIADDDLVELVTSTGGVRTVLLAPR